MNYHTPHTCTTRLAPGAPWPAFVHSAVPHQPAFKQPARAGRLTDTQRAQDMAAVLTALATHGPCSLSRLGKHTGVSRHRVALVIGHLVRQQPQRLGIVRQEIWNNSMPSDIFGFLQ